MNAKTSNGLLLGATVALVVFALAFSRPATGEAFGSSDVQAGEVVQELRPDYQPWFSPLWQPPGGEIESLLFGLQSAVGAGLLCYALGYWRGVRKNRKGADA